MEDLVSIVVPVYNAERFIRDTINCVLAQTYSNWELILVNDCSTDNSVSIIKEYMKNDNRIILYSNEINSKTAVTRNNGIKIAKGRYLCFLDADDIWDKDKLKKQITFMKNNECAFSFTGYEFANEDAQPNGKKVYVPEKMTYKDALKNTTIWTSTVMFDMTKLNKDNIYMPNVKSEDTACWWKVLKIVDYSYGLNEVLAYYRRTQGSLSSNKIEAIKRIWNLYRNVENLGLLYSIYCFIGYAVRAVMRRI